MGIYESFERTTFVIFFLFGIIGVCFTMVVLHELSHKQDFHSYVKEDYICALVLPEKISGFWKDLDAPAGYYGFIYDKNNETIVKEIQKIEEYTEKKAYFITFIIGVIFFVCFLMQIRERFKGKVGVQLYEDLKEEIENETK